MMPKISPSWISRLISSSAVTAWGVPGS